MTAIPPATFAAMEAELLSDEGEVLRVYDDATGKVIGKGSTLIGNPTIGRGRCLSTNGISQQESRMLCDNDINAAWEELAPLLPWLQDLSTPRQIVLLSMYFNMYLHHPQGFIHGWPHFIEQVRAGDYSAAADNMEHAQPWSIEVGPRAHVLGEMMRHG